MSRSRSNRPRRRNSQFKSRRARKRRRERERRRSLFSTLQHERLEDRHLLAVDVSLIGDQLLVEGTNVNDVVTIQLVDGGDTIRISDLGGANGDTGEDGISEPDDNTVEVDLTEADVTSIFVDLAGFNDELIVDNSGGLFTVPIFYDGGGGFDKLTSIGSTEVAETTLAVGSTPDQGQLIDTLEVENGDNEELPPVDSTDPTVQTISFQNIEPVTTNIVAATFSVTSVPGISSILQADNAINYEAGQLLATGGRITVDAFEIVEFENKTTVVIDAGAGSDLINLNNPNTPTALTDIMVNADDPTAGSDTVVVNGTTGQDTIAVGTFDVDGATITGAQPVTVTVDTAELLIIDGQGGGDDVTFTLPDNIEVDFFAGDSTDAGSLRTSAGILAGLASLPVDYKNLGSGGSIEIEDAGDRTVTLRVHGSDVADVFNLDGDDPDSIRISQPISNSLTLPIFTAGVGRVHLLGHDGDDVFVVDSTHPYSGQVFVEGGNGISGDRIQITATGDSRLDTNSVSFSQDYDGQLFDLGNGAVVYRGAESVHINVANNALSVAGTPQDDHFIVTPGNAGAAQFTHNNSPTMLFSYGNASGPVSFSGGTNTTVNDILEIVGQETADVVTSTATAISVDGSEIGVASSLEILRLNTLGGNDNINLDLNVEVEKFVDAGAGEDIVDLGGTIDATIFGGLGDDVIIGSPVFDLIFGGSGNDTITGLGGNDEIYGDEGDDTITAGTGEDQVFGGDGSDTLFWNFGDGSDLFEGGAGESDELVFNGNTAANRIEVFGGGLFGATVNPAPAIFPLGTLENASRAILALNSTAQDMAAVFVNMGDVEQIDIRADEGADEIVINNIENTTTTLGSTVQRATDLKHTALRGIEIDVGATDGASDSLEVFGMLTDDDIFASRIAGPVAAAIIDVAGFDYNITLKNPVLSDADRFVLRGERGDDIIEVDVGVESHTSVSIFGEDGNDILSGDALTIQGGDGNDFIRGGAGANLLIGGRDDDTFVGGAGADTINGGTGFDTILIEGTPGDDDILVNQTAATTLVHTVNGVTETDTLELHGNDDRTVESALIQAGDGDDVIAVNWADSLGFDVDLNALRMDVEGGPAHTQDRLGVFDSGFGELAIHRIGAEAGTGSFTLGPLNGEPLIAFYEGIEYAERAAPAGANDTGQVVVFKVDPFEFNNTRDNATFLGAGETLNVDPNIDPGADSSIPGFPLPADEDWYRVVAENTGTLDFQVYFEEIPFAPSGRLGLPGNGNLDIEVYDVDGTLIAGSGLAFGGNDGGGTNPEINDDGDAAEEDERVRIPAVQGQTYFLRVFGAAANVINTYDITVINDLSPVPYDLELDDSPIDGTPNPPGQLNNSDTGRSQDDNITYDNTPEIFLRLDDAIFLQDLPGNPAADSPPDEVIPIPFNAEQTLDPTLPGYRVAIFDEILPQVPVGFARMISPGVYAFDFQTDAIGAPVVLTDGSHFLSARVQMIDPATPLQTGFGDRSVSLEIFVDTVAPPLHFGLPEAGGGTTLTDGLHPNSDSGVPGPGVTPTLSDRITNDTTPTFWGTAEADAFIRAYVDVNGNGMVDIGTDVFIGATTVIPIDGTNQFGLDPNDLAEGTGYWELTSAVDLNDPAAFPTPLPLDGLRTILITAEDVAGNITDGADAAAVQDLDIFIDTQGPQITGIEITGSPGFNLFDPKPVADGPTPLVNSLTINVEDLPDRVAQFLYNALEDRGPTGVPGPPGGNPSANPGNFLVVGDSNGVIPIMDIVLTNAAPVAGQPATATIELIFFEALPDDRYTLTITDDVVDPAGNALDGESNAIEPNGAPNFPTGNGVPGGNFMGRFTVDSRPEIGHYTGITVVSDINGNFTFDPANQDFTNRDLIFDFGSTSDQRFTGKFNVGGNNPFLFDVLAAYGQQGGVFRLLIDDNLNGAFDAGETNVVLGVNGLVGAGDFGGLFGDEIVVFDGATWSFFDITGAPVGAPFPTNITGHPVVGDFDGDGLDDLGTYDASDDLWQFDLANDGLGSTADPGGPDATLTTFFAIGVSERGLAADMDQDGIDDIGLWIPATETQGVDNAEWRFLISNDFGAANRVTGTINTLDHAYSPEPLGNDLFAVFGDSFALPIVGNLDPPVGATAPATVTLDGGTVNVVGTNVDDDFAVIVTDTTVDVLVNGENYGFALSAIDTIMIDGAEGEDSLTLGGPVDDSLLLYLGSDELEFHAAGERLVAASSIEDVNELDVDVASAREVKRLTRPNGTVYSLDSNNFMSINGQLAWSKTADFDIGDDGTLYWLGTSGRLQKRLTNGTWVDIDFDVAKFQVDSTGKVYSLRNDDRLAVNGSTGWARTADFAIGDDDRLYWLGTNSLLQRRDHNGSWTTLDSSVTKFRVHGNGSAYSLNDSNWLSINGHRVWGKTADFDLDDDNTLYWHGTNSLVQRRAHGGSWETVDYHVAEFAVHVDRSVYAKRDDGSVSVEGAVMWQNVLGESLDEFVGLAAYQADDANDVDYVFERL